MEALQAQLDQQLHNHIEMRIAQFTVQIEQSQRNAEERYRAAIDRADSMGDNPAYVTLVARFKQSAKSVLDHETESNKHSVTDFINRMRALKS